MIQKKVTRYYSECGKGFWKKKSALNHEENCKCWSNPKNKTCKTCAFNEHYYDRYDDHETGCAGEGHINECTQNIDSSSPLWNQKNEIIYDVNINCVKWEPIY